MKQLPNIITLCNLAVGFLAVIMAFENQLLFAGTLILIAAVLDFLDGFIAKLLNVTGELGKQLDSLADLVSFGMAPAVLAYQLLGFVIRQSEGIQGITEAPVGVRILMLSPVMLLLCAAVRLASFNLQGQARGFTGLATPAAGIFFAGITLSALRHPGEALTGTFMQVTPIVACIVIISILMILPLPMFSLKFSTYRWKENRIRYIFLAISGFLLIILQEIALPAIIIIYMLASIFEHIISPISK